jgi:serine/threonine protein kinase
LIQERVNRLKAVTHPGLAMPIAAGDLEGRAWVVEPQLTTPTVLLRLGDGGAMSVRRGILALRDVTRALASLHRSGLAHGALDLTNIHLDGDGTAQLTGFGAQASGDIRGDLDALGPIAWAIFTGDLADGVVPRLGTRRRGVPEGLDALVASLMAPEVSQRPARAEAVLDSLDAFPTLQLSPIASFLEGAGRGTRSPRARETLFLTLLFGLTLLVATLIFER